MGNYCFVLACPSEAVEVFELYHSLVGVPGNVWNQDYPDINIVKADISAETLYVFKDSERIIAAVAIGVYSDLDFLEWGMKKPCDIERLGVLPSKLNQGIGSAIMQNIIVLARSRGFDGIRLIVSNGNYPAIALYAKYGFEKCGEAFMYGSDFYCYRLKFS